MISNYCLYFVILSLVVVLTVPFGISSWSIKEGVIRLNCLFHFPRNIFPMKCEVWFNNGFIFFHCVGDANLLEECPVAQCLMLHREGNLPAHCSGAAFSRVVSTLNISSPCSDYYFSRGDGRCFVSDNVQHCGGCIQVCYWWHGGGMRGNVYHLRDIRGWWLFCLCDC